MVEYPNINGAKKPVAVRVNADGKREYCFGLELWRPTVKLAWQAYEQVTTAHVPTRVTLVITAKTTRTATDHLWRMTLEFPVNVPSDFGQRLQGVRSFVWSQHPNAVWLEVDDKNIWILTEE